VRELRVVVVRVLDEVPDRDGGVPEAGEQRDAVAQQHPVVRRETAQRQDADCERRGDPEPEQPVRLELLARTFELVVVRMPPAVERASGDLQDGGDGEQLE
jgi:hypothetical protein